MKAKNIILFGALAIMLFAFALSAEATTVISIPNAINGTASNSTTQNITVAITGKTTTLNFTQLNISYSTRGGANTTFCFINVSNATTDSLDCPTQLNLQTLPEGVLDILVKTCNGTACAVGTGNQNGTINVQNNPPGVVSMTPTTNLEDSTTITLTVNETADCRYSQTNLGYLNMTTATVGNSTVPTVSSPLRENSDRTFYFACIDEFQNQGPTFTQRLRHASSTSVFTGSAAVGGISGTTGGISSTTQSGSKVSEFLGMFSDNPAIQKVIGVLLLLAVLGGLIALAIKYL